MSHPSLGRILAAAALCSLLPLAASAQCLVPNESLVSGGVGKDAIPALEDPDVIFADEGDGVFRAGDLVLGVVINGEARAYPHRILWWHEIINDEVGGVHIAVTYCPLTGSGLVYDRIIDGRLIDFGTSGLLMDNNLVMYDRATDSLWSQMMGISICGVRRSYEAAFYPVVETTWGAWRQLHPDTTVVGTDTGFNRNYNRYPYGDYATKSNPRLLFPISFFDTRLLPKSIVHGIENGGVSRAYAADVLVDVGPRGAVNDRVNGRAVVVVFDLERELIISFDRKVRVLKKNGKWKNKTLSFEVVEGSGWPFMLREKRSGTLFDLEGEPVEGKLLGKLEAERLPRVAEAYNAYWFAWAAFQRGTEIWGRPPAE